MDKFFIEQHTSELSRPAWRLSLPCGPPFFSSLSMHRTLPLLVAGCLAALLTGSVHAEESPRDVRVALFEYCQNVTWSYGHDGVPTTNSEVRAGPEPEAAARSTDPDRDAFFLAGGREDRLGAFLDWAFLERSVPGEFSFVAGFDRGGVIAISDRGSEIRCLKRFDVAAGTVECLTPTNGRHDLLGPIFAEDAGSPCWRLAGVRWLDEHGPSNEWFDAAMAAAERRLCEAFPGCRPEWIEQSPTSPDRWIVECRFADRPPVWMETDVRSGSVRTLSRFDGNVSPMRREVFRWRARDGETVSGIVSLPGGDGPFPLVVFPHGGPGTLSDATFDERVWALVDSGFAVLQPNYRGSSGFGLEFRLDGWGADGIQRAFDDIFGMTEAVRGDARLPVASSKPVLLGGSWGGYCVLALLARHPESCAGGVSFFGAFDLPALVAGEAERIEKEGGRDMETVKLALFRQFGDPSDPSAMARLADLSPVNRASDIAAPVVLCHNRGDTVIPFVQSEAMFAALTNCASPVELLAGDGCHGFSPAEEVDAYSSLARRFDLWIRAPATGRRPLAIR